MLSVCSEEGWGKGGGNLNIKGGGGGQEGNLNVWKQGRNLKVWGAGGQGNFPSKCSLLVVFMWYVFLIWCDMLLR